MTTTTSARRSTRRTSAAVVLTVLLAAALPLVVGAGPAGAIDNDIGSAVVQPVTWVDAQGRQYLVGAASDGNRQHPSADLVGSRGLADGRPDPSCCRFTVTPPAPDLRMETVVAADGAGQIATTWIPAACDPVAGACARWFVRSTARGTTLGTPNQVTADDRPVRHLPDGSFLTAHPNGAIGWRAADGTDRLAPSFDVHDIDGATVDGLGRLLLTLDGHAVVRWHAGGGITDLPDVTGCAAHANLVVGRSSSENGFALACTTSKGTMLVQRRSGTGTATWTTTRAGTDPSGVLEVPQTVLLDDLGRVWVGGRGTIQTESPEYAVAMAQAWSSAGPGEIGYVAKIRAFMQYDTSRTITDLRQAPGHRVAVADEEGCCIVSSGGGELPWSSIHGAVAPSPVSAATAVRPFSSVGAFVRQQYLDLVGRLPAGEPGTSAQLIASGRIAPEAFVARLLHTGRGGHQVEPIYRLYPAFFQRNADIAGLRFYVGQLRSGRPLAAIAQEFAASDEFQRRYGDLSLADFVRTLYRNVFGREGDAAGMDYWYRRLATGRITRGAMVVQFSESPEHVRGEAPVSQGVAATFLLLDRRPTQDEANTWRYRPDVSRTAARDLLASSAYAARF